MTRRPCPVPSCHQALPEGPHAAFCVDHHFEAPVKLTNMIFRLSVSASRTSDVEERKHLVEQRDAHIRMVIRTMGWDAAPKATGGAHAA